MIRKILTAAALMVALVVPGVAATAGTASAATPSAMALSSNAGNFDTYDQCVSAGDYGVQTGSWVSYSCEFDGIYYELMVNYATQTQPCGSDAVAYVVRSGQAYFSGYEGSESLGVPTLYIQHGQHVTLGGNGIKPGQQVFFYFYDDSGNQRGSGASHSANGGCVANEHEITINLPAGHYVAKGYYQSGNTGNIYFQRETFLQVY